MLLVAEIGLNHDGDFDRAKEMIRQAKLAGADIAKFQFGWRDGPGEINQIDAERALDLKRCCADNDIEFMASIITEKAFDMARQVGLARYKIASRTVVENPALAEKVLGEGKETFVSLGMWEGSGFPFGPPDDRLRYIFCVSKYPTMDEDLAGIPDTFSETEYYGYSDHTLGIEACLLAIGRGARYIEKHFTFDKTSQVIRDHVLSATPDEFKLIHEIGRPMARLNGVLTRDRSV